MTEISVPAFPTADEIDAAVAEMCGGFEADGIRPSPEVLALMRMVLRLATETAFIDTGDPATTGVYRRAAGEEGDWGRLELVRPN